MDKHLDIRIDCSRKYQKIDGFGVNINSKCWNNGKLIPVMDMLIHDLGATLYRLDAYGKSNWIDPENKLDESALNEENYKKVYSGIDFRNAESMCKYLNSKGIEPYITLSGIVPDWMCDKDKATLKKYSEFAEMAVSFIHWLKKEAGIKFKLFGPFNETDVGPPEGPKILTEGFTKALEVLIDKLDDRGLNDIKLVVTEQGSLNLNYFNYIIKSRKLANRIGIFGFHTYLDGSSENIVQAVKQSHFKDCNVWMTEYGDLDQSGDKEKEWPFAWVIFERLMNLLRSGMNGALNWDAYDNYHDHNEKWTIYGLIHSEKDVYTPKKRYYSTKQAYRFILPGFYRVETSSSNEQLPVLAFTSPDGKDFTLIGMNKSQGDICADVQVKDITTPLPELKAELYQTNETDDCVHTATVDNKGPSNHKKMEIVIPPQSIFTLTTIRK